MRQATKHVIQSSLYKITLCVPKELLSNSSLVWPSYQMSVWGRSFVSLERKEGRKLAEWSRFVGKADRKKGGRRGPASLGGERSCLALPAFYSPYILSG